ncbi:hypothetical protein EU545_04035 [Candidatus Thorarchaeota archaeon]|nr:MAG: hypothetical protein EU545_04035 [Candidatus Thorarchaeota archaeon]
MTNVNRSPGPKKPFSEFILELGEIGKKHQVGNKAKNLAFLVKHGYNVPRTLVCVFEAFSKYSQGDESVPEALREELAFHLRRDKKYSVRSSANIEDSTSYSFAGQFATHLNVEGVDAVVDAIQRVWESVGEVNRKHYIKETRSRESIEMAVIIQEMVNPEFSGVVFTRNPLTGLDEVVVESVDGLGDALVQEGVTPDRWVYKWGDWVEKEKDKEERIPVIEKIIEESRNLAEEYGAPLDLEWCYDGDEVYWLQLREITALDSTKLFSNRISREFLPGMIKPLVWSVNIPVVNSSWKKLFSEAIGGAADSIDIHNLSKPFYYRAYFNMGVIGDIFEVLGMPREALEILAGIEASGKDRPMFRPSSRTFVHLPRMLVTALRKFMFSKAIEIFLRDYQRHYDRIDSVDLDTLNIRETLAYIDELFELNTYGSYMVIVSQLLNSIYNMMLNGMLSNRGINTENLRLIPNTERLRESDPRSTLQQLHEAYSNLTESRKEVADENIADLTDEIKRTEFGELFEDFMKRFGHLSDSGNDFSRPSWRETPDLVLGMVKSAKSSERGRALDQNEALKDFLEESRMNKTIFNRAMRYQEYRELVNSLYTYGYSQFRRYFLHLGSLLEEEGFIQESDHIFYLEYKEVLRLIDGELSKKSAQDRIIERRNEMEEFTDFVLPEVIIGDAPPLNIDHRKVGEELTGVATSGGNYVGPAKVVMGIGDFDKIEEGDVLVIPYSDVSWTPLFSKAKAVVSESGGLLSHCSIVAREYGIPAVVSVDRATSISDGTTLAIDGNNGIVILLE